MVRAVNVGGTARLPMAEWRALAEELGASDVATYIQSGNLVCTPPGDADDFDRALERAVEERFGFFREVISRDRSELVAALEAFPFVDDPPKFAHIVFLVSEPTPESIVAAGEVPTGEDVWALRGREFFVRYANGAGRSNPGLTKVGRLLGVPGTSRNLLTVRKLVALAE
jgi:uncharacterized protein (DUF1697 family)